MQTNQNLNQNQFMFSFAPIILLIQGFQAPISVFTLESLGEAYAAFDTPESVTIQSVYPAFRGEKSERDFAMMKLRFVAKPRKINPAMMRRLIDNYKNPYRVLEPNCAFHPDHLVTFRRGGHLVETVSCFTCDELLVLADGRFLGRVSMGPPKVLRTIYTMSVPLSDTIRAGAEEWLTREFVDELTRSGSVTITKSSLTGIGIPKKLSAWNFESKSISADRNWKRSLFDALAMHCLNSRLSFRFAQPDMATFDPPGVTIRSGKHALVLHGSYNRAELYYNGNWVRTIDFFGSEDRLQTLVFAAIKR